MSYYADGDHSPGVDVAPPKGSAVPFQDQVHGNEIQSSNESLAGHNQEEEVGEGKVHVTCMIGEPIISFAHLIVEIGATNSKRNTC